MWAYCRIWRKDEGQFYLWCPHSELAWWQSGAALCRPESMSFHRGWVPLEGSTNMDMCTDSFLTCWPCAWEPDLLLYISKPLKSHGNSYPLPVKPRAAHLPVNAILPAPSPASWHTTAVTGGCPHLPFGSPMGQCSSPLWLSYYCPSDWPFQFFSCNPNLSLFLSFAHSAHFYWDFLLLVGSSLLCWNDVFSFLSSSLLFAVYTVVSQISYPTFRIIWIFCSQFFLALLHTLLHLSFHAINTHLTALSTLLLLIPLSAITLNIQDRAVRRRGMR